MSAVVFNGQAELEAKVDAAIEGDTNEADVVARVTDALTGMIKEGKIVLPESHRQPHPDHYARRLLFASEKHGYAAIVMVWGIGQGTYLHDHDHNWGIVGVVEGVLDVVDYDLLDRTDGLYKFEAKEKISAGVGAAGVVVPPYEYHTILNAVPDKPSISLHIYESEMTECGIFMPNDDGLYKYSIKQLSYTE